MLRGLTRTSSSQAWASRFHATDDRSTLAGYASIIGIVTAIIGNILISFALNIQRYAHIRLSREKDQQARGGRTDKGKRGATGYGTVSRTRSGGPEQSASSEQASNATETDPLARSYSADLVPDSEKGGKDEQQKTYLHSPYWWAGILLMTVGEAGNFLAYGFAPASIVSPLGVVALVSNCVIAPIMLKEDFRKRDALGVLVAIGGAVTVVLSAATSETQLGPHEIIDAITRSAFEAYVGVTAAMIIVGMWASSRYGERTILIDLGLVALFGKRPPLDSSSRHSSSYRRLHRPLHQGCRVSPLVHAVASADIPHHLCSPHYPLRHSRAADQVRESCPAALRLDPGHPHAVCALHHLRHRRQRHPVSRFRAGRRHARGGAAGRQADQLASTLHRRAAPGARRSGHPGRRRPCSLDRHLFTSQCQCDAAGFSIAELCGREPVAVRVGATWSTSLRRVRSLEHRIVSDATIRSADVAVAIARQRKHYEQAVNAIESLARAHLTGPVHVTAVVIPECSGRRFSATRECRLPLSQAPTRSIQSRSAATEHGGSGQVPIAQRSWSRHDAVRRRCGRCNTYQGCGGPAIRPRWIRARSRRLKASDDRNGEESDVDFGKSNKRTAPGKE